MLVDSGNNAYSILFNLAASIEYGSYDSESNVNGYHGSESYTNDRWVGVCK